MTASPTRIWAPQDRDFVVVVLVSSIWRGLTHRWCSINISEWTKQVWGDITSVERTSWEPAVPQVNQVIFFKKRYFHLHMSKVSGTWHSYNSPREWGQILNPIPQPEGSFPLHKAFGLSNTESTHPKWRDAQYVLLARNTDINKFQSQAPRFAQKRQEVEWVEGQGTASQILHNQEIDNREGKGSGVPNNSTNSSPHQKGC